RPDHDLAAPANDATRPVVEPHHRVDALVEGGGKTARRGRLGALLVLVLVLALVGVDAECFERLPGAPALLGRRVVAAQDPAQRVDRPALAVAALLVVVALLDAIEEGIARVLRARARERRADHDS